MKQQSRANHKKRPLRVLFLMNCFKGQAAGECYYQLAKELVRNGCRVSVLLPQDKHTPAREVMDGIVVHRFSYFWPRSSHAVAYGLGIPENLKASWMARLQLPFFMLFFLLRGMMLARHFDVVHAITTGPGLAGAAAKILWKKPFFITVTGTDIREGPPAFNRFLLKYTDGVVAANKEGKDILATLGRKDRIYDIKHLIDFSRFQPSSNTRREVRDEFGIESHDFVVTFVGRVYPIKDPVTFVKAAALVKQHRPAIRFLLVGSGQQSEEVADLVKQLDIADVLHLTGHRSDVDRILAASDVFVAISPLDNCYSATILEAMSVGLPNILSDTGATSQAFPHRQNAYLVPPQDPEALAQAILTLQQDTRLRKQLGGSGLSCLRRLGFDRDVIVEQTRDMYEEYLPPIKENR